MPSEADPLPVRVEYTPEFKRNLRQLAKRYKRIKTDVQPLLDILEQGQTPGDLIPGALYEVYKGRARNSDSGKGKSGGYRVIYQRTVEGAIVLVTIYSKSEQEDIAPHEIRQILRDYESDAHELNDASEEITPSDPAPE